MKFPAKLPKIREGKLSRGKSGKISMEDAEGWPSGGGDTVLIDIRPDYPLLEIGGAHRSVRFLSSPLTPSSPTSPLHLLFVTRACELHDFYVPPAVSSRPGALPCYACGGADTFSADIDAPDTSVFWHDVEGVPGVWTPEDCNR